MILIAGAGEPAARLIERQLAAANIPVALQEASKAIAHELAQGRPVADVPEALAALYRSSVQPYLMSWLPLDPARALSKVACPVLLIQGTTDLQVGISDADRLFAASPAAQLIFIEGMNHIMKPAPAERTANLMTYSDPHAPVAPELTTAIATFLNRLQRTEQA